MVCWDLRPILGAASGSVGAFPHTTPGALPHIGQSSAVFDNEQRPFESPAMLGACAAQTSACDPGTAVDPCNGRGTLKPPDRA